MNEKKSKIYYEIVSKLYDVTRTAIEENDLTYYEIIGLLEKLKQHLVINTTTDIMIKRDIKRNFNEPT